MIKETIKFNISKERTLNEREKSINTQIQKTIDLYNSRGLIVVDHKVLNKTNINATVGFTLKQMIRG